VCTGFGVLTLLSGQPECPSSPSGPCRERRSGLKAVTHSLWDANGRWLTTETASSTDRNRPGQRLIGETSGSAALRASVPAT